jgi:hypothetical protein
MVQLNFLIIIFFSCTMNINAKCGQEITTTIIITSTSDPLGQFNQLLVATRNPVTNIKNRVITHTREYLTTTLFSFTGSTEFPRSLKTRLTLKTMTTTTSIVLSTTTINTMFNAYICPKYRLNTRQFGGIGSSFYSVYFNVLVSNLKSFELSSGTYVHSINFVFKNGTSVFYGSQKTNRVKIKTTINIEDKTIVAVRGSSDKLWLKNIQFLIYDHKENSYTWTASLNDEVDTFNVNAGNYEPLSSYFEITRINGYAHPTNQIGAVGFQYTYSECNPFGSPITTPSIIFKQTPNILSTISITSTILIEDNY